MVTPNTVVTKENVMEELNKQTSKCYFCGKEVDENSYCYGCGEYVCGNCCVEAPWGKHSVGDHQPEEEDLD